MIEPNSVCLRWLSRTRKKGKGYHVTFPKKIFRIFEGTIKGFISPAPENSRFALPYFLKAFLLYWGVIRNDSSNRNSQV